MKIAAIIPARLESARFPLKLLQDLGGKPVIQHTCEAVMQSGLFDEVAIATDSTEIEEVCQRIGARVIRTGAHETGSDRIAEAASSVDAEIIINVQADEPFINVQALQDLISIFRNDIHGKTAMASLKMRIDDPEEVSNPNVVKVITAQDGRAMYFSRLPIPYQRDSAEITPIYYRHIGVYGFRRAALLDFAKLPQTPLELAEKIECLRFLEHGLQIIMAETDHVGVGIDTPEDLERARLLLQEKL